MPEKLSQSRLKRLLTYNPNTGDFFWLPRENASPQWNGRYGNTKAGSNIRSRGHIYYRKINIGGNIYSAHRLAFFYMTGEIPKGVDHIDGNSLNNAWSNLRPANQSQNMANSRLGAHNTTGYKGVHFHKKNKCYVAYISVNRRRQHLGCFATAKEAHEAYKKAATERFGEFARDR